MTSADLGSSVRLSQAKLVSAHPQRADPARLCSANEPIRASGFFASSPLPPVSSRRWFSSKRLSLKRAGNMLPCSSGPRQGLGATDHTSSAMLLTSCRMASSCFPFGTRYPVPVGLVATRRPSRREAAGQAGHGPYASPLGGMLPQLAHLATVVARPEPASSQEKYPSYPYGPSALLDDRSLHRSSVRKHYLSISNG